MASARATALAATGLAGLAGPDEDGREAVQPEMTPDPRTAAARAVISGSRVRRPRFGGFAGRIGTVPS
jgi:hypothetical protein